MTPFLKWPGGKRWFVRQFSGLLPKQFNRYLEPFLGSGSVYFHLKPTNALLADSNPHLIATYLAIRSDWSRLEQILEQHHNKHNVRYYYKIRAVAPRAQVQKASRMIYLNRTCFNGIYRTNRKGQFNVPPGDRRQIVRATDNFRSVSELLAGAEIRHSDFEPIIDEARKGDFIFADPPYTVRHRLNGFLRYNEVLFSWADQERLANALTRAHRRGVKVMCTNADHASIRKLYRISGFRIRTISRFSAISSASANRRVFTELIISANI